MKSEIVYPAEHIPEGGKEIVNSPEIWFIDPSEGGGFCVKLTWMGGSAELNTKNLQGKPCFILMHNVDVSVLSGKVVFKKIRLEPLSKLLAFIDEALKMPDAYTPPPHFSYLAKDLVKQMVKENSFECFINNAALHSNELKPVLALLRHTESYNLVRFLYAKSPEKITLTNLGKQYGVSYSHFRRLCQHALCGHVKENICNWRMAKTILEFIEGKNDITTAALKNGYASSSHFSHEVKVKMGISLRSLKKLLIQRTTGCG